MQWKIAILENKLVMAFCMSLRPCSYLVLSCVLVHFWCPCLDVMLHDTQEPMRIDVTVVLSYFSVYMSSIIWFDLHFKFCSVYYTKLQKTSIKSVELFITFMLPFCPFLEIETVRLHWLHYESKHSWKILHLKAEKLSYRFWMTRANKWWQNLYP